MFSSRSQLTIVYSTFSEKEHKVQPTLRKGSGIRPLASPAACSWGANISRTVCSPQKEQKF